MKTQTQLLSEEMAAVADSLRDIRRRLSSLIGEVGVPPYVIPHDITTILVGGLDLLEALERLAEVCRGRT